MMTRQWANKDSQIWTSECQETMNYESYVQLSAHEPLNRSRTLILLSSWLMLSNRN